MNPDKSSTRRWLLPTGLTVLVITLVAIALTRGPAKLDPDTPEGTVQEYLLAIHDKQWDTAIEVIHKDWRGECDAQDLARFADFEFSAELGPGDGEFDEGVVRKGFEIVGRGRIPPPDIIEEGGGFVGQGVPIEEDLADSDNFVEVVINRNDGGPFGSSWNEYVVFEMIDEDDFWWIGGDPWPYFVWDCRS
ncbi:MAG TPA: hypothetical protein VE569_13640 [Acidimicrobiia bacterium]|nr:hypothetical protein [Acidimicrobiia bacterium]